MADNTALQAAAYKNLPPVMFAGSTPLEQLSSGFAAARASIFKYVPVGQELDYDQALAADEIISANISQNIDQIKYHLDSGKDLPESLAITLGAEQCRQYFLSQYAIAAAGIGAYFSDYARQRVQSGIITQSEYDAGIDVRLSIFSRIVLLDQKGLLSSVLQPEKNAAAIAAASAAYQKDLAAGLIGSSALMVRSQSLAISTASKQPAGLGGDPVTLAIIVAAVAIAVIACFVAWRYFESNTAKANAAVMVEACRDAVKYNNKTAIDACTKNYDQLKSGGLLEQLVGKDTSKEVVKWVAIGIGAYLVIQFLPQITSSLFTTQDVMTERMRERALAKARRGS